MVESESNIPSIDQVFKNFTGGKNEMDNKQMIKMCKDCKVLDKKVTSTDVDITFTKHSNKTNKKCNLSQWKLVLADFAKKKGITEEEMHMVLRKVGVKKFDGATKTDNVRLHDDKSNYTGVYAKGGPSTVDS